jgi:Tol biopolymer transport system component/DNA-binding winged helix-turn-helix (wHTH) protein
MLRHDTQLYEFGPFRLDAGERVLLRTGDVVHLTPKAIDLLVVLVEKSGHVLSKDELMRQVWPDSFVEEANLSHQIFSLRKALGEERNGSKYIETVPRRGYRFVANVTAIGIEPDDLIIAEHTRARIVIEQTESEPPEAVGGGMEVETAELSVRPKSLSPSDNEAEIESNNALKMEIVGERKDARSSLLNRRQAMPAMLMVGLLAVGGAVLFPWSMMFKGRQAETHGLKLKIVRLTSSNKAVSSISSDGKFICYVQNYFDGIGTLWVRQAGANREIQLIEPGDRVFYGTAFSPDGQSVYFSAVDRHDTAGALYSVPTLGGPPTRLVGAFGSMFTLSPDGRQAAFYRYSPDGKRRSLMIAALDGSGEQSLLTFNLPEQRFIGGPSWGPDGKQIAFAAATGPEPANANGRFSILAIDIAGRKTIPLTTERWSEVGKLVWASDGRKLYFVAKRPHVGNQLYYLDHPGGETHQLTSGVQGYGNYGLGITADGTTLIADAWETSFHIWKINADGRIESADRLTRGLDDGSSGITVLADGRIVYVSRTGDDLDLWAMRPDGADAKALTADSFDERDVTATADGRYLVFASSRAGRSHLFRLETDGSDPKQLTFGEGFDSTPHCSSDGKWIVYASRSGNESTIWKIPIDGGTPVKLTNYHSIEPSFSPDGKFISCILPADSRIEKGTLAIIPADGGSPGKTFRILQFAHHYATPRWSPDGQSIVFAEQINGAGNLWKQPLDGGAPQKITDFKTDHVSNFFFSPDGKSIVLARGPKGAYVVQLNDFN